MRPERVKRLVCRFVLLTAINILLLIVGNEVLEVVWTEDRSRTDVAATSDMSDTSAETRRMIEAAVNGNASAFNSIIHDDLHNSSTFNDRFENGEFFVVESLF